MDSGDEWEYKSYVSVSPTPQPTITMDEAKYRAQLNSRLRQLYDDLEENDFEEQEDRGKVDYLHIITKAVPIGPNNQAVLPPLISEAAYREKSAQNLRVIQSIQLNHRQESACFQEQCRSYIEKELGTGKTYQEIVSVRSAYMPFLGQYSLEHFLTLTRHLWVSHFKCKDKSSFGRSVMKKKKRANQTYLF